MFYSLTSNFTVNFSFLVNKFYYFNKKNYYTSQTILSFEIFIFKHFITIFLWSMRWMYARSTFSGFYFLLTQQIEEGKKTHQSWIIIVRLDEMGRKNIFLFTHRLDELCENVVVYNQTIKKDTFHKLNPIYRNKCLLLTIS